MWYHFSSQITYSCLSTSFWQQWIIEPLRTTKTMKNVPRKSTKVFHCTCCDSMREPLKLFIVGKNCFAITGYVLYTNHLPKCGEQMVTGKGERNVCEEKDTLICIPKSFVQRLRKDRILQQFWFFT